MQVRREGAPARRPGELWRSHAHRTKRHHFRSPSPWRGRIGRGWRRNFCGGRAYVQRPRARECRFRQPGNVLSRLTSPPLNKRRAATLYRPGTNALVIGCAGAEGRTERPGPIVGVRLLLYGQTHFVTGAPCATTVIDARRHECRGLARRDVEPRAGH